MKDEGKTLIERLGEFTSGILKVKAWAKATCENSAYLEESDLHNRFQSIFPRFHKSGHSALLCVGDDVPPSQTPYTFYDIRASMPNTSDTRAMEEKKDEDNVEAIKRSKILDHSVVNTLHVGVPTYLADILDFGTIIPQLNESIEPTKVIFGFVVAMLGGTLHMSYPPKEDEMKLYCHVSMLQQRYGRSEGEVLAILENVLDGLNGSPPDAEKMESQDLEALKRSNRDLMYTMFECVWMECNGNEKLIRLLAPRLTLESDHLNIMKRLGGLLSLHPKPFLDFVQWKYDNMFYEWKTAEEGDASRAIDRLSWDYHFEPISYQHPKHTINSELAQTWISGVFKTQSGAQSFGQFLPKSLLPSPLPATLVAFASSLLDSNAETADDSSSMVYLAHFEVVYQKWSWFKHLINSGLSESISRFITLPFSLGAIRLVLQTIYDAPIHQYEKVDTGALFDILNFGAEFGLFSSLQSGGLLAEKLCSTYEAVSIDVKYDETLFKSLVDKAVGELLLVVAQMWDEIEALNTGFKLGLHDWCEKNLVLVQRRHYIEQNPRHLANLVPELREKLAPIEEQKSTNKNIK